MNKAINESRSTAISYVTLAEAAKLLRVSRPTLRRAINSGVIPVLRVGARSVRVPMASLTR